MKKIRNLLALLLMLALAVGIFASCGGNGDTPDGPDTPDVPNDPGTADIVDYAASVKLDWTSNSAKAEVTVKGFIDGDTTHFNVPKSLVGTEVLKARYLAINTPESTGKVEEWGKTAASFTREKLENATSIVIESDDGKWNADSTGGRYLVWVWYKTDDMDDYRNLNIEILQEGLAIASNSAQNRYGSTCMNAINQAKGQKLCVYSGKKDPNFFYGSAIELTLRELRTNIEEYDGQKVAFNGVITNDYGNSLYVESYDEETDMYYGISVYYGYSFDPFGLQIMQIGNELRIVGTVSYYEGGGTYQVSGIKYNFMDEGNPENIALINENCEPSYRVTDIDTFKNGQVTVLIDDEEKTFSYAELAMNTSVLFEGLIVKSVYTTNNEESSSNGAMTITCEIDGKEIDIRTVVLYKDGQLVTAESFPVGTVLDVKGVVDYFNGEYQIKVFSINDITIK